MKKAVCFLVYLFSNAFLSIFISLVVYIAIGIIFILSLVPVSIFGGDDLARHLIYLAGHNLWGYLAVYLLVFMFLPKWRPFIYQKVEQ